MAATRCAVSVFPAALPCLCTKCFKFVAQLVLQCGLGSSVERPACLTSVLSPSCVDLPGCGLVTALRSAVCQDPGSSRTRHGCGVHENRPHRARFITKALTTHV